MYDILSIGYLETKTKFELGFFLSAVNFPQSIKNRAFLVKFLSKSTTILKWDNKG